MPDAQTTTRLWRTVQMIRLRLGSAIIGGGWLGCLMRYRLIDQRARACITPEGQVILSECAPLAEALYAPIPGEWQLSITRAATPEQQERQ